MNVQKMYVLMRCRHDIIGRWYTNTVAWELFFIILPDVQEKRVHLFLRKPRNRLKLWPPERFYAQSLTRCNDYSSSQNRWSVLRKGIILQTQIAKEFGIFPHISWYLLHHGTLLPTIILKEHTLGLIKVNEMHRRQGTKLPSQQPQNFKLTSISKGDRRRPQIHHINELRNRWTMLFRLFILARNAQRCCTQQLPLISIHNARREDFIHVQNRAVHRARVQTKAFPQIAHPVHQITSVRHKSRMWVVELEQTLIFEHIALQIVWVHAYDIS
mmetsp:Transcript_4596/g.6719  ORF Transcript_4596/g.6719 Transcript_4596/m.6719 type:complete len:271 (-) Transcript_4596:260-1072(-)